jgi:hypothetical protein
MNHIFQKTVYSSLLIVEEQIRLVRLLPRLLSDDIEIELIRADLASKPQYEALSYEWGPPCDSTSSVFIHGECRLVQENLWWALRYLRLDSQPRILWIDALCINQDDIVERNRQVRQMGRIYEQSSRVIVWMGYLNTIERDQDTSTAVTFLHDISLNYSEYAYRENQPWGSLEKLCYKNYWTRLWIIQEVVLATDILVQCGSYSFEWNILAGILDQLDIFLDHPKFLQEKGLYEVGQMIHKSIPGRLHRQRIARQSEDSKAQSLLNLLWTYKDAACVDPRDKVFGLHSLSEDCCKNALSIDYAKSTFEIGGMLLEHHFSHHMRASELLPFPACQRLHDLLQAKISFVISSRSLRPIDYHYGSAEDKLVELAGTVVGNISWLSPFFDSLPPDDVLITSESKKAAAYQKMMGDIPQIRMIMSSLNYPLEFWRQLPPRIPPPLYKDATHAGLTFSLHNLDSFATGALRAQPPPLQYSRSIRKVSDSLKASLKNRASIVSDKWVEKDSDSIFRWWKWLVSPCPKDERPRTRILFSGNGLIGFAPGTADVGDVVCQIDNSDTFVVLRPGVVRPSGLRHEIIGRSSIIQLGTPTSPGVEPAKARLQVDIPTLQLLSWVKES